MCLAIPMKITGIKGDEATVELDGLRRDINLGLLEDIRPGDYVIVHAGFAIQKLDQTAARETLSLFEEMNSA